MRFFLSSIFGIALSSVVMSVHAEDVLTTKTIGMELARDIASAAVIECRNQGYQVTAVVVDRNGNVKAVLRDDLASRFSIQIAEEKANSVVMSGINSGTFRDSRPDIRPELNHVRGLIMMQGGLPIISAGSRIGAVGVSGAPGGEKDEVCAQHALDTVTERLEFAD